jgi:hypothetical protein
VYRTVLLSTFFIVFAVSMSGLDSQWGSLNTQVRLNSMIEENQDPLLDYAGTAIGGKIVYRTPQWKNIHGVIGVYASRFIHDNVSSDRVEPLASNRASRYVAGLVDTTDLDANGVAGIGEVYVEYLNPKGSVSIGRMKLDTPFINPQDGRMIPTFEQGLWMKYGIAPQWSVQGGVINGFWNRNTSGWKSVEDSLGYGYEMGNAPLTSAVKGDYYKNTDSSGIFVGNIRYEDDSLRVDLWDYYVENIFNLGYAETDFLHRTGSIKLTYGAQVIHQQEVGEGGNGEDDLLGATEAQKAKSYMAQGEKSTTYGAKISSDYLDTRLTFAYNKTTGNGRFLFPREWGKEPLYTFQKRERSDGSGHCDAWLITLEHDFVREGISGLSMMAGYGEYDKSDPKEWRTNKYGTPSYAQWNIDVFYRFKGVLKGLRAEYLMVRKVARGETYQISGTSEYNFIFRKNGMNLHNFILNYDF